jgi:hypothetical protein
VAALAAFRLSEAALKVDRPRFTVVTIDESIDVVSAHALAADPIDIRGAVTNRCLVQCGNGSVVRDTGGRRPCA